MSDIHVVLKKKVNRLKLRAIILRTRRYLINDSYWDKNDNSPIFFYTGNEGSIELFAQNTGFMWEIAAEFKATLGNSKMKLKKNRFLK